MSDPTPGDAVATAHPSPLAAEDSWWDEAGTDEVEGYDLLRQDALEQLVGVPFKGIKVVFRDGIQRKGSPQRDDYVSLELHVAPAAIIARDAKRIETRRSAANLSLLGMAQPDEYLVVNDGSTGIYRQIVQYLAARELITLPEGPTEGEKGDCIYDYPRSLWLSGADEATEGIEIKLKCSRGLRVSEYSNAYTGEEKARTWYIA